ncbi:MAG: hypothetical protein IJN80_01835, partial [Clostridia bacterium]|nr:hypothetical protein [Clostridia bacterium]
MFTRKTRVMSAILTVCMMISMMACIVIHVHAEDAFNAENTAKITAFTESTATAESAYVITTPEEMEYAATIANNDLLKNTTVYLAADINLTGKGDFIGFGAAQFNIDGQGHTISNWKNTTAAQVALVMKGKTESIKNIKFYDCDLKTTNHSALVYGSHNNDGVSNGSLTISGITIENCDITNTSDQVAFILPNLQQRPATISDIIVKNSTITGTGGPWNNLAIIVARIPTAKALNVTNVYADNVTITGGKDNGGILIGKPDTSSTTPIVKNAVVSNCSMTATGDTGVLGGRISGNPTLDNILIYNPTINAPTPYYVWGNLDWYTYGHSTNLYTSAVSFNYGLTNGSGSATTKVPFNVITADQYTSGEQAYTMSNNAKGNYTMFWAMDNGKIVPSDLAHSTHKAELVLANGKVIKSVYANGGESIELSLAEDPNATFEWQSGSGTLSGKTLTMPQDGSVTKIVVSTTTDAFDYLNYPSVTTVNEAADRTQKDYTIANVTEWLHFYTVYPYFQSQDVTIHLIGDIDMSGVTTIAGCPSGRYSFMNPSFSIDGHNKTIKNWGTKNNRFATAGLIRIQSDSNVPYAADGQGIKFIKNLKFENCHTTGSGGANTALIFTTWGEDAGLDCMASEFTMENVHVKNCSVNGEANRNAIFMSNYAKKNGAYTVNMKNCS